MNRMKQEGDRVIEVDLLALDLGECRRCATSLRNIEAAVDLARPVFVAMGADVRLRSTVIDSLEAARRSRLVSSPTLRVNGRDVPIPTIETPCDDCGDLCGGGTDTLCRVWPYRGGQYQEAPIGLVVEALFSASLEPADHAVDAYVDVPDNLQRFFSGRAEMRAAGATPCCTPSAKETCCDAEAKTACCGPTAAQCGCR